LFDANGLSRGHYMYYANGRDLGRYWTLAAGKGAAADPVQRYYYIPTDVSVAAG
jgi:hypothetical protein